MDNGGEDGGDDGGEGGNSLFVLGVQSAPVAEPAFSYGKADWLIGSHPDNQLHRKPITGRMPGTALLQERAVVKQGPFVPHRSVSLGNPRDGSIRTNLIRPSRAVAMATCL